MAGGYALSGRGPVWARLAAGAVAILPIPAWALAATFIGSSDLTFGTPRGAWLAVYFGSFLAVLALACSIPHRKVVEPTGGEGVPDPAADPAADRRAHVIESGRRSPE